MAMFGTYGPVASSPERETRTNNQLFRSDLEPTFGPYLADPRLPHKFQYPFGGDGDNWVVIPKGKIVSIVPGEYRVKAFPSGKEYPALTIANGGKDVTELDQQKLDAGVTGTPEYVRKANVPVGVADRNIFKKIDRTFYGNEPMFRRYGVIELPHILDPDDAAAMKWACVIGDVGHTDYLKSDENGNWVKWIKGQDDREQIVGQVIFIDHNVPPEGWLQWVKGGDIDALVDPMIAKKKDMPYEGYRAEDLMANGGFPYNPIYRKEWHDGPTGIAGLTDGSRLQTPFTGEVLGMVPETAAVGERLYFHLEHTPVVAGTLKITVGGTEVTPEHVDLRTGLVVIVVPENDEGGAVTGEVVADYSATGQVGGWPSHWDFKGSVGGVRIALKIGG